MSALRPLLRLAVRDARRRPGRSALVVVLIAIPTMLFATAAIGFRTVPDMPDEAASKMLGQADQQLTTDVTMRSDLARAVEALPAGSTTVPLNEHFGSVTAGAGPRPKRFRVQIFEGDAGHPLLEGKFRLEQGRWASGPSEVVVSPDIAKVVDIGGSIALRSGSVRVTGVARNASNFSTSMLVGRGDLADRVQRQESGLLSVFVDLPPGAEMPVVPLGPSSVPSAVSTTVGVTDRFSFTAATPQSGELTLLYLLGTLGLAAFGLVVASALAVGARRQLRAIGLLGATGATPRQCAASQLLHGSTVGLIGAALGLAAAPLLWNVSRPLVERWTFSFVGPMQVRAGDVLGIGALAVLVAVSAAILPARVAARTSVLQALGGRRPLPRLGLRMPMAGLLVSVAGCLGLAAVVSSDPSGPGEAIALTLSTALIIAGLVICAPWLVGRLEPLASRLSGDRRLALRTVARQRARTGPTVAAIMATGALALAAATIGLSAAEGEDAANQQFANDLVLADVQSFTGTAVSCDQVSRGLAPQIEAIVAGARSTCVEQTGVFGGEGGFVFGVEPRELGVLGLERYADALRDGRALLVQGEDGLPAAAETIRLRGRNETRTVPLLATPGTRTTFRVTGSYLVSRALVSRLGHDSATYPWATLIARAPVPLSDVQTARLRELAESDLGAMLGSDGLRPEAFLMFADQYRSPILTIVYGVVLPIAIVLAPTGRPDRTVPDGDRDPRRAGDLRRGRGGPAPPPPSERLAGMGGHRDGDAPGVTRRPGDRRDRLDRVEPADHGAVVGHLGVGRRAPARRRSRRVGADAQGVERVDSPHGVALGLCRERRGERLSVPRCSRHATKE